jgi:hypothetical protein
MVSIRKRLENKLDALWRSVGKENARCEICETLPYSDRINYTKLDPHHIIGRNNKMLRWDLKNRLLVCTRHHTMGKPSEIVQDNLGGWFLNWESDSDWMGTHRPEDKEYLREKYKIPYKQWTIEELEGMILELSSYDPTRL